MRKGILAIILILSLEASSDASILSKIGKGLWKIVKWPVGITLRAFLDKHGNPTFKE